MFKLLFHCSVIKANLIILTHISPTSITMQIFPPTLILRHRKENLKKCSLRGLEQREDFSFFSYPTATLPSNVEKYILLTIDAPPLSSSENEHGLFVLDATWRYADAMFKWVTDLKIPFIHRSIPAACKTAYPRYQTGCPVPEQGLASIEAIYVAYLILQRDTSSLLDNYYWKEEFLIKNNNLFSSIRDNI